MLNTKPLLHAFSVPSTPVWLQLKYWGWQEWHFGKLPIATHVNSATQSVVGTGGTGLFIGTEDPPLLEAIPGIEVTVHKVWHFASGEQRPDAKLKYSPPSH